MEHFDVVTGPACGPRVTERELGRFLGGRLG